MFIRFSIVLLAAIAIGAALVAPLASCTDAQRAAASAYGSRHKVTLYSGGVAVRTWESTGAVLNEDHSDGYYFEDAATHRMVTVSGNVAIETE